MGLVGIHTPSEGHEAAYVGTAYALEEGDWVFPLYRELPVYIALKVSLGELISRHLSNAEDRLKGHDFAVYGDIRYRIVPAPVPVSLHIAPAVGFALAFKKRGLKHIVINYFGDGATSKGEFHEALNFAGVFKAPVVFVCVNNQYAISTPFSRQTAAETIAQKAVAYGIEGVRVDGNDVVGCYMAALRAAQRARDGDGPTLIEALTYRLGPHTTADDPTRYRSPEEVEMWRRKDPIKRVKKNISSKEVYGVRRRKSLCGNGVKPP
jgi:pyruvate dehydrogenase E1 component alpha subunit